jgi:putative membrane protein
MHTDVRSTTEARDPRVYFAAERTLLAWIRTGLAMMGFGFVVARFGLFLRELAAANASAPQPRGTVSLWAGTALVVVGVLVNLWAATQHRGFLRRFHRAEAPAYPRVSVGVVLALLLAIIGISMAVYLVLVR